MNVNPIDILTLLSFFGVVLLLFKLTRQPNASGGLPQAATRRLEVLQPTCRNCAHWDREEGQQVMDKFPAFKGASTAITPAEMAYGYDYDPETGDRLALKGPKSATTFAWPDFGACSVHAELRHVSDTCADFAVREDA